MTWASSVAILFLLGLSVLDLGPMYATDRRQTDVRQTDVRQMSDVRQKNRLMPPPISDGGIIIHHTDALGQPSPLHAPRINVLQSLCSCRGRVCDLTSDLVFLTFACGKPRHSLTDPTRLATANRSRVSIRGRPYKITSH